MNFPKFTQEEIQSFLQSLSDEIIDFSKQHKVILYETGFLHRVPIDEETYGDFIVYRGSFEECEAFCKLNDVVKKIAKHLLECTEESYSKQKGNYEHWLSQGNILLSNETKQAMQLYDRRRKALRILLAKFGEVQNP